MLPSQRAPQQVAAPREESTSTRHSLDTEINQFHFSEVGGVSKKLVEFSDSSIGSDESSAAHQVKLIIARPNSSSEEEEDMDLKRRSGLKGLLANRGKGQTSKEASKAQVTPSLPPPPPPPLLPTDLGSKALPDLKKKRPFENLEEGEVAPKKSAKKQRRPKDPQDGRAKSVESREDAEGHQGQCTRLDVEAIPIPWDATIWES